MQNGPADQADLADFVARSNKPDLVELLRHAGERLPSGSDTAADQRLCRGHTPRFTLFPGSVSLQRMPCTRDTSFSLSFFLFVVFESI